MFLSTMSDNKIWININMYQYWSWIKVTTKDFEASSFASSTTELSITFTNKIPNIVSHHVLVISSFRSGVQSLGYFGGSARLAPLSKLPCSWIYQDERQEEEHNAAYFAAILHQSLSLLHAVFRLVNTQKLWTTATKMCHAAFPFWWSSWGIPCTSGSLCGPTKTPAWPCLGRKS